MIKTLFFKQPPKKKKEHPRRLVYKNDRLGLGAEVQVTLIQGNSRNLNRINLGYHKKRMFVHP